MITAKRINFVDYIKQVIICRISPVISSDLEHSHDFYAHNFVSLVHHFVRAA
jgi:hypothetical protein